MHILHGRHKVVFCVDLATDCLSYIRLRDLTARSPQLLEVAMTHVLMILNGEVSHSQDYGEREVLLPLLHLFREFLIMVSASEVHVLLYTFSLGAFFSSSGVHVIYYYLLLRLTPY